jgi:small-conductance mechanosensitive channel
MNKTKQVATIMLIIFLGIIAYGLFRTGRSITTSQIIPGERSEAAHGSVIDQTPLYTARRLAQMPTSGDELPLAQEALRLGDREMDLAFAAAVSEADTLQAVISAGLQIIALGLILLVIFGPPSQLATILGLAGAGLTVALKDFIVSFLGWFVLMGRNGIRLGDWVEINGVTGEVVELGMFHTVLLETGNWTDSGHPTGRRVTFTNSFAIEGHYFNFSTSGQWLWDELTLVLASTLSLFHIVRQTSSNEFSYDFSLLLSEQNKLEKSVA